MRAVLNEVIRPDVVGIFRPQTDAGSVVDPGCVKTRPMI
jgi:hypothetical protein